MMDSIIISYLMFGTMDLDFSMLFIISIVWLAHFIFWAEAVREQAGNDERMWFYLTILFSPLWILYRVVSWK